MQNNEVKALEVAIPDRKPTFKDKSASTHITMDFGTVVPGHFERIYPDTEFSVGDRERVILTSLVAPCFGDLSLKSFSYFVPFSALTRNYSAMMAQQSVNRGSSSFVPQSLPSIEMRDLSLAVLTGAQMTVYAYNRTTQQYHLYALPANQTVNESLSNLPSMMQAMVANLGLTNAYSEHGLQNAWSIDLAKIVGMTGSSTSRIPLGNVYPSTFFDARVNHPDDTVPNMNPVGLGPNEYDYVVPVNVKEVGTSNYVDYILAFRLSSFGRRLRKILIGLGWQFSLTSVKPFSFMRLVAWYCAYFELFQPKRYKNWEQTYAYELMQRADLQSSPAFKAFTSTASPSNIVRNFLIDELGACFYTDPMDFVAAHNRQDTVSPGFTAGLFGSLQVNVDNIGVNISDSDTSSQLNYNTSTSGHAFINTTQHGALDEKILMRLYRTTNVLTPAGRRIEEMCRAQGLGPDMEKVKAKFVGSWELDLDIYDLPAQSDTYNKVSEDGKQLGEFGAYGKSTGKHEKVHYKTSEDGYFINLIAVVPKGGYCETVDPSSTRLSKYDQFNPIFDSVGYQFNTKDETILGSITWQQTGYENATGTTDGTLTDSFGLAPRYFEKKFGRNVINGDFSLNSKRNAYSQWNLEKILSANDHTVHNIQRDSSGNETAIVVRNSKPGDLPIAGDVWRYTARYEWLSRFNRIFYNSFSTFSQMTGISDSVRTAMYELFSLRDDNFILHIRYDIAVYDKMLPVSRSFETEDEELKANSKMSKA